MVVDGRSGGGVGPGGMAGGPTGGRTPTTGRMSPLEPLPLVPPASVPSQIGPGSGGLRRGGRYICVTKML